MFTYLARQAVCSKLSPLVLAFSLLASASAPAMAARLPHPHTKSVPAVLKASYGENEVARDLAEWQILLQEQNDATFARYATFMNAHPDWPRRSRMALLAEKRLTGAETPLQLKAFFATLPPQTVRGLEAYIAALGPTADTASVIRKFWIEADMTDAEQAAFLQRHTDRLSEADVEARADRLILTPNFEQAQLLPLSPAHKPAYAARVQMRTQMKAVRRNDMGAAQVRQIDARVQPLSATEVQKPGFIYDYANYLEYAGQPQRAAALLATIPDRAHPNISYGWKVRENIARMALEGGDPQMAYKLASHHGLIAGDETSYRDAEWLSGWIALRFLRQPAQAAQHFNRVFSLSASIISRSRAAYWMARSAAAAGEPDKANRWYDVAANYDTTYYGQLAMLERHGEVPMVVRDADNPSEASRKAFAGRDMVKVIEAAAKLGDMDVAEVFMRNLAKNVSSQDEATLLIRLGRTLGRKDLAVLASFEVGAKGYFIGREAYPIISGVPGAPENALIHAIIRRESQFNRMAKSPTGALGLMQVMPATAREEAKRQNVKNHKDDDLTSPAHNMQLGSAYLQKMIDNFRGSYVMAMAAYNGGPGNVSKWVCRFGDPRQPDLRARPLPDATGMMNDICDSYSNALPQLYAKAQATDTQLHQLVDWVEMIPLSETRNYVQRVTESLQVYRGVLGNGNKTTLAIRRDLLRNNM